MPTSRYRRLLFALLLALLLAPAPVVATTDVSARIFLDSDDWYPLPKEQMKAAAWDAALAEITQTVHFRLLGEDDGVAASSQLYGELSLIGPAEVVKFTLRYHPHEGPTLVSTASMSIRGMDRQGFFNAFEYVGTRAATDLADQALVRSQQASLADEGRAVDDSSLEESALDEAIIETIVIDNTSIGETYNRAQELKRNGDYQHARQALVAVRDMARPDQQEWADMAEEELNYGLLVHEAQHLSLSLWDPHMAYGDAQAIVALAINRTREAIAGNLTHAARMRELQRMLDDLEMAREGLERSERMQLMAAVAPYRVLLTEAWAMSGRCVGPDQVQQYFRGSPMRGAELIAVRGDPEDRLYVFESTNSSSRTMLRCRNGNITPQEYEPADGTS